VADPLETCSYANAIRFKFGTDIEDHKTTPNGAWPRSRDPISEI